MTDAIRNGHRETCPASRGAPPCYCDWPGGATPAPDLPVPTGDLSVAFAMRAQQEAMLTALSEAVTHAQDQLPESQAQVWRDAQLLVWEALGVT